MLQLAVNKFDSQLEHQEEWRKMPRNIEAVDVVDTSDPNMPAYMKEILQQAEARKKRDIERDQIFLNEIWNKWISNLLSFFLIPISDFPKRCLKFLRRHTLIQRQLVILVPNGWFFYYRVLVIFLNIE